MNISEFVAAQVAESYHTHDRNCASTSLHILSDRFQVELSSQVIDAASGMWGAGGYRAQCGLVEGPLMFIGIYGKVLGCSDKRIGEFCKQFAELFEKQCSSLLCKELRPEGFNPKNPPHLCEPLSRRLIEFQIDFITGMKETILSESNE